MTLTRHENGAGATPTCGRRQRRRRADQLQSAAAAASAKCRRRRRGGSGAQLYSEPFNALNLFRCLLDVYVDTQSLWQSTSKCFSANSLLARSSWRASDLRLLDSMIVCILLVPSCFRFLYKRCNIFPSCSSTFNRNNRRCIFWYELYWNGLVWFFTPQNIGIATKIILIPCVVAEIFIKKRYFQKWRS